VTLKNNKKIAGKRRFFLFFIPLAFLLGLAIIFISVRAVNDKETCGCYSVDGQGTGDFEEDDNIAYFNNQPTDFGFEEGPAKPENLLLAEGAILGATTDERWIEIDLSDQRLLAHEGERIVYNFLMSSGKWALTPVGTFRIWSKFKYTKMSGGSKEKRTYYYLPNVPYVMYFYNGYGMHGTYWHQNFGEPMSHGCINLATPDAEKLFYWASPVLPKGQSLVRATADNPGLKVVIHE